MKRSRSGQCGFLGSWRMTPPAYRAVSTSTADSDEDGCPEPASVVMLTMSLRTVFANCLSCARSGWLLIHHLPAWSDLFSLARGMTNLKSNMDRHAVHRQRRLADRFVQRR